MRLESLSFKKNRFFSLAGDARTSVLGEVIKTSNLKPSFRIISQTDGNLNDDVTLPRLLAGATESLRGELSIALPLDFFEIVTISLPQMAEEAVSKALPYHLAKLIDKPLPELIYDWQITQRQKEQLQVTVYLFSASTYHRLRKELSRKQLDIKYLEADVFAAFSFLGKSGRIQSDEVTLCALIWPDSISIAVCENKIITLVRSVSLKQPQNPYSKTSQEILPTTDPDSEEKNQPQDPDTEIELSMEIPGDTTEKKSQDQKENTITPTNENEEDVLAGFSLFAEPKNEISMESPKVSSGDKNSDETEGPSSLPEVSDKTEKTWTEYLQNINLEIMRTKDYYSSVVKGGVIKQMIVSGDEVYWEELQDLVRSAVGINIEQLSNSPLIPENPPPLETVCIGAGTR